MRYPDEATVSNGILMVSGRPRGTHPRSIQPNEIERVVVEEVQGEEIARRGIFVILTSGERLSLPALSGEAVHELLRDLRRYNRSIELENRTSVLDEVGSVPKEIKGRHPAVLYAYSLALAQLLIGALFIVFAAIVQARSGRLYSGMTISGVVAFLGALTSFGFVWGYPLARIILAGECVTGALIGGGFAVKAVLLDGWSTPYLMLTIPVIAAIGGSFAFIHPEVLRWCADRQSARRGHPTLKG